MLIFQDKPMQNQNIRPFFYFLVALFLIVTSQALFADTMFVDGLIYATIAKNLAEGKGTFWNLHFTNTFLSEFHEHPPLAMGLESIYFKLFGSSRFVEKFYSLTTCLLVVFGIMKLWIQLGFQKNTRWSPILFWMFIPVIFWSCNNNLLENTLVIFTTFSIYFALKSTTKKPYYYLILAGLMLSFGFLTKGFVAFFPLSYFFFCWLFERKYSFIKMVKHTLLYLIFSIVPLVIIWFISPEAKLSLWNYFQIQVVKSLETIVTVESRFFIVKRMFSEMILPIVIALIFYFSYFKKRLELRLTQEQRATSFTFLALGLSAVLPIMVSMKQSGFYILTAYPFFAIAVANFVSPQLTAFTNKLTLTEKVNKRFRNVSLGFLVIGIAFAFLSTSKFGKDEVKVKDMRVIFNQLPKNSTISICPAMNEDWALHSYYQRYKSVSLDYDFKNQHPYLLIRPSECNDFQIPVEYKEVKLNTIEYKLFRLSKVQ